MFKALVQLICNRDIGRYRIPLHLLNTIYLVPQNTLRRLKGCMFHLSGRVLHDQFSYIRNPIEIGSCNSDAHKQNRSRGSLSYQP